MRTQSAEESAQVISDHGQAAAAAKVNNGQSIDGAPKNGSSAIVASVKTSTLAIKALTEAYQDVATQRIDALGKAVEELSRVKRPQDFFDLQQKLIKDSIEAAVTDSQRIARLVAAVYSSPFESPQTRGIPGPETTQH